MHQACAHTRAPKLVEVPTHRKDLDSLHTIACPPPDGVEKICHYFGRQSLASLCVHQADARSLVHDQKRLDDADVAFLLDQIPRRSSVLLKHRGLPPHERIMTSHLEDALGRTGNAFCACPSGVQLATVRLLLARLSTCLLTLLSVRVAKVLPCAIAPAALVCAFAPSSIRSWRQKAHCQCVSLRSIRFVFRGRLLVTELGAAPCSSTTSAPTTVATLSVLSLCTSPQWTGTTKTAPILMASCEVVHPTCTPVTVGK